MILAPARNQPPAYTEASPMIWIWARGLANGAHEASSHDSGLGPPPAYTEASSTI